MPKDGSTQTVRPAHKFRRLPLRLVLTVPFVVQTIGLATLVGYLSYQNGQKSVNDLAQSLQTEVQSRIRDRLNNYFAIPPQINQINSDAHELGQLNLSDFKTTGQYFWRQLQVFDVSFVNYATLKGEYIGTGDFGDGTIRIEEIPLNTQKTSFQYGTDSKGNRTQRLGTQSYNPYEEAWFIDTLKAKKPIWSQIYNWDGYPEILSISANHPVYDARSTLIGILGVDLKLSTISEFLGQLKIGQSGKAFILERSGLLVASSVKEPPFLMVNGAAQRLPAIKSQDADIRDTTAALLANFGSFTTLQGDRRLTLEIAGQRKYVQLGSWRDSLGLDWLVVMVVPESDFMAQIQSNTQRTILLSLGALAIATALGILTARWISNPILRLSQASQSLAQAAQDRFRGTSPQLNGASAIQEHIQEQIQEPIQELDSLSQSFYQMGTQLQQSFAELETINEALEQRVEQRTKDLQQANATITELNKILQTDNLRMSAELDVTRRLQQMILPKPSEFEHLKDLDIACFMEAAQEVGGDYYDVIPGDRYLTLGIGDVTGHGLESGILMIMAQTAVRTLIAADELVATKEPDSAKFLIALNQVLYDNVQRLRPGKDMSMTLLRYWDNQIQISGQHETVLVFRAAGGVEKVDTIDLGMPLGLTENIQDFVGKTQIDLNPGDGVVLYTDGVTEAEGANRSLYGLERLIAVVQRHWSEPAQTIQEQVIADVRSHIGNHRVYDDITLVILKQKAPQSDGDTLAHS